MLIKAPLVPCCCQVSSTVHHSSLCQVLPSGVSFARHFASSTSQALFCSLPFSIFVPIADEPLDLHLEYSVNVKVVMRLAIAVAVIKVIASRINRAITVATRGSQRVARIKVATADT